MTTDTNWTRDTKTPGVYWASAAGGTTLCVRLQGQKWVLTVHGLGRRTRLTEAFDRRP